MSELVKWGIIAATVLGIIGGSYAGYKYWEHKIYQQGWNAHVVYVKQKNEEAKNAAKAAIKKPRACRASGGTWSQSRGVCTPAS